MSSMHIGDHPLGTATQNAHLASLALCQTSKGGYFAHCLINNVLKEYIYYHVDSKMGMAIAFHGCGSNILWPWQLNLWRSVNRCVQLSEIQISDVLLYLYIEIDRVHYTKVLYMFREQRFKMD